jgi:hypothetical protein
MSDPDVCKVFLCSNVDGKERVRELDPDHQLDTMAGQIVQSISKKPHAIWRVSMSDKSIDLTDINECITELAAMIKEHDKKPSIASVQGYAKIINEFFCWESDKKYSWTLGYEAPNTNGGYDFKSVSVTDPNHPLRTTLGQIWDSMYGHSNSMVDQIEHIVDAGPCNVIKESLTQVLTQLESMVREVMISANGNSDANQTSGPSIKALIKSIHKDWLPMMIYWLQYYRSYNSSGMAQILVRDCRFVSPEHIIKNLRAAMQQFIHTELIGLKPLDFHEIADSNCSSCCHHCNALSDTISRMWEAFNLCVSNTIVKTCNARSTPQDRITYAQILHDVANGTNTKSDEQDMYDNKIVKWSLVRSAAGTTATTIPLVKKMQPNGRARQVNVLGMNAVCSPAGEEVLESDLHSNPRCLLMDMISGVMTNTFDCSSTVSAIVFQRTIATHSNTRSIGWHLRLVTTSASKVRASLEQKLIWVLDAKKNGADANTTGKYPVINIYE